MSGAKLRVWPAITRARIAPELYGHQLEMVGQSVYEGIWIGRASRVSNEEGLRMDVLAILKHLRVPVLKWPGDTFADYYHWRDGVGTGKPREQRVNIPWQQIEPNTFGTHEFMLLCEKVGCKPWITCNSGTGNFREALDWLEYCTFGGDTALTRLRTHNGHPDPFEVPYWSYASADPEQTLRVLNPDITETRSTANPTQTNKTKHNPIRLSHLLETTGGANFGKDGYLGSIAGYRRFASEILGLLHSLAAINPDVPHPVAVTQWGVRHPEATPESGLDQPCTLRDAILTAAFLHFFNEHADRIQMAAMAQAVNSLLCLVKTQDGEMFLTPAYHVVDMMQPHKGARLLLHDLESPAMVLPATAVGSSTIPALNVSTSRTKKRLCVTVANLSYTDEIPLAVEVREASIVSLSGRMLTAPSAAAENSFESPKVVTPARLTLTHEEHSFSHVMPPHSFAVFTVNLK
jgi:alpha-N-arabinofuranosidase